MTSLVLVPDSNRPSCGVFQVEGKRWWLCPRIFTTGPLANDFEDLDTINGDTVYKAVSPDLLLGKRVGPVGFSHNLYSLRFTNDSERV